jgi:hypothetical protein
MTEGFSQFLQSVQRFAQSEFHFDLMAESGSIASEAGRGKRTSVGWRLRES